MKGERRQLVNDAAHQMSELFSVSDIKEVFPIS